MATTPLPRSPAQGWEEKRDQWVAEVARFLTEAETWAQRQGWAVQRDQKTIAEDRLGTYVVPVLLIQSPRGRLLLDPIARDVVGAGGRIDFCLLPSYDPTPIIRTDDGWHFYSVERGELQGAWSEEAFLALAQRLLAAS